MKKFKRFLALFLAFVLLATNDPGISQVFASNSDLDISQDTGTNEEGGTVTPEASPSPTATPEATQTPEASPSLTATPEATQTPEAAPAPTKTPETAIPPSGARNTPAGGGMDILLSSQLIVNGGDTVVDTGETFQYELSYTVPNLETGEYVGTYLTFTLPKYVEIVTDENDAYKIVGADYSHTVYNNITNIYTVFFKEPLPKHEADTLRITMKTNNFVTPDGFELKFNDFTFVTDFKVSETERVTMSQKLNAGTITTEASADWGIEKSVVKPANSDYDYVRVDADGNPAEKGAYYDVTYRVVISDAGTVDRLGRLGFQEYLVTDTLPSAGIPTGGEAISVHDVKIVHGADEVALTADDYTVNNANGHPASITFKTLDAIRESESNQSQYLEAGDITNTTYEYTVRYPYEPYVTKSNELDIKEYVLTNTAELDYKLVGGFENKETSSAQFEIAAYEDSVIKADVEVTKYIQVAGQEYQMTEDWATKYGFTGDHVVKFSLYTDEDCTTYAYSTTKKQLSNVTVDSSGVATFNDVRIGTYYLKEENLPVGYAAPGVVEVTISDTNTVKCKYVNIAKDFGIVSFTKVGSDSYDSAEHALAGAEFQLLDSDGNVVGTATSDATGGVRFDNIPVGTYTLKETNISDALKNLGYEVSATTYQVTVVSDQITKPELDGSNQYKNISPKGLLEITKVDAHNTKQTLAGAEFELYGPYTAAPTGNELTAPAAAKAATLTTGSNGKAVSGPITEGYYVLVETKAPTNYTAGDNQVVQVVARTTEKVIVENNPQAEVVFRKRGSESVNGNIVQELTGAKFEVYTADGSKLYGVKDSTGDFVNVSTDSTGRVAVVIETRLDATGKSTSNSVSLSPGNYQYKEIYVPSPYKAVDTLKSFSVSQVAPSTPGGAWATSQTITVNNYLEYGQIRIIKDASNVDETESTKDKVNGAEFKVYSDAACTQLVDTITTGSYYNGTNLEYGIGYSDASLELGKTYYIKETKAPSGYALNTEVKAVTVTTDKKLVTYTCVNYPTVSIELTKVDSKSTTTALSNATFELYGSKKDDNGNDVIDMDNKIAAKTTGSNGKVVFDGLSPSTVYFYKETKVPTGYILDSEPVKVTTNASGSDVVTATVTNDRYATLKLKKTKEGDAPFSGVPFSLYKVTDGTKGILEDTNNLADNIVGTTKSTANDGTLSFTDLTPGDYWLVETVPEHYRTGGSTGTQVGSTGWTVAVVNGVEYFYMKVSVEAAENTDTGRTQVYQITNTPTSGKIQLKKYAANADGTKGSVLPGVTFTVYSDAECKTVVTTLETSGNGEATSGFIAPGTYFIKETKVPTGYVMSDTVYTVEVEANETATTATANGQSVNLQEIINVKTGGFSIDKTAAHKINGTTTESVEPLNGAIFTLYSYLESDGALTEKPELPQDLTSREVVKTIDMSARSSASVSGIEPGIYWLRETTVPDSNKKDSIAEYQQADDILIQVLGDGTVQLGTIGTNGVTWAESSANLKVEVKNYSLQPRIRLIKIEFNNPSVKLDGAKFEVYVKAKSQDGSVGKAETINEETVYLLPLKSDGSIGAVGDAPYILESGSTVDPNNTSQHIKGEDLTPMLQAGYTYYFKETQAPSGYHTDPTNIWSSVFVPEGATEEFQFTVENYKDILAPGVKVDGNNNAKLAGAVLAVFDNEADVRNMLWILTNNYNEAVEKPATPVEGQKYRMTKADVEANADTWNIDEYSDSDSSGVFQFENLIPGQYYYIIELVSPNGYQLDRNANGDYFYYKVKVSDEIYQTNGKPFDEVYKDGILQTGVYQLQIPNYLRHRIWLDKKAVLSGVEYWIDGAGFTIYGSKLENGNYVPDTTVVVGYLESSGSTAKGKYVSGLLPAGIYFIEETAFPTGLQLAKRELNDFVDIDKIRYYKVELGRNADNTSFSTNPIYNEAAYGRFAFTKINSETSAKIQATFSVEKYNSTSKAFESYAALNSFTTSTTDAYYFSALIEPGIYKLTETAVSGNYTKLTEPIYIEIGAGKITDGAAAVVERTLLIGTENVTVKVYPPTDSVKLKTEADDNTDPVLENSIVVENVPQGRFYIQKTGTWNNDSAENLSGVKFDIYKKETTLTGIPTATLIINAFNADTENGTKNKVKTITTDANGKADSGLLDAGEYWVIEAGFNSSEDAAEYGKSSYTPFVMTVVAGQTGTQNTKSVVNTSNYGKFKVTKVDSVDSSVGITGVTFQIYKGNPDFDTSSEMVGTMSGKGNGVYESPLLEPGHNYYLKETKAADGYSINVGKIFGPFTVTANKMEDKGTITNEHDKTLVIQKYESDGSKSPIETTNALSGAKFALYTSETAAQDATESAQGNPVKSGTTGNDGKITWTGLSDGTYYLKELAAPSGYIADSAVYKIVISGKNGSSFTYSQTVYNLKLGGFELQKVVSWAQDDTTTKNPVRDITFTLYEGTTVNEAKKITDLKTNENGVISYQLPAGDYLLVENMTGDYGKDTTQYDAADTDQDGNYIDSTGIHIRVLPSQINKEFTGDNAVNNIANFGRFELTKKIYSKDDHSAWIGLNGAEYKLEKQEADQTWTDLGTLSVNAADWKNGVYTSGAMMPGTYRVTETKAPSNIQNSDGTEVKFTVDPEPIVFTIEAGKTIEIDQFDGIYRNLLVIKTADDDGDYTNDQPLANVTFELYAYNTEAGLNDSAISMTNYKDYVVGKAPAEEGGEVAYEAIGTKTTGSDGKVTFNDLLPGKYVLVETSVPDGYEQQVKIVELTEAKSYLDVTQEYSILNTSSKGRLVIRKEDSAGQPVIIKDNAVFKIYADNVTDFTTATALDTVEITENGTGQSILLPIGEYWVVETKAPDGYSLDDRLKPVILKKKVKISGDQDPTITDWSSVSKNAKDGYVDFVIFQNRLYDSVDLVESSIEKGVRIKGANGGYTVDQEGTAQIASTESLMDKDITVEYLISELTTATSKNEIPLTSFVVTDDTLTFYSKDRTVDGIYHDMQLPADADNYVMNQITLGASKNADETKVVSASVYVKVDGESGAAWVETAHAVIDDLSQETRVTLPANTVGFRVEYANADIGFTAGDIGVEVTFKQRPSDADLNEVRKIVNKVSLAWEDTSLDKNGAPAHKKGVVDDDAAVTFPIYDDNLPILALTNEITNLPPSELYYSGDAVEFLTEASVIEASPKDLPHLVMSINLPSYTSLDTTKYPEGGGSGIRATLVDGDDRTVITNFGLEKITEVDSNGVEYEKYVLDFGEDFTLEKGQSMQLEYVANIALAVPDTTIFLDTTGFAGSGHQLPLTVENPTGVCYTQMAGDASGLSAGDAGFDTGLMNLGNTIEGGSLTYLKRPRTIQLTRSDSLQIRKYISTDNQSWTATEIPTVKPADMVYYKLSLVNGGDAVQTARFIDIIPFDGDTQEFRASDSSIMTRSTDLPTGAGYEEVQLVSVTPEISEGITATVYYYVESDNDNDWTVANRLNKPAAAELPMLSTKADAATVWAGWTTAKPADMTTVTAVGIEVNFDKDHYFESGDTYNVYMQMKMPGYTAEHMYDYENAIIGNTTSATVTRATDTTASAVKAEDRVSSNQVKNKLYITTGTIGDIAFYDNNDNGIQDLEDGDIPARHIPVTLYRRKTTTDDTTGKWEVYKTTTTDQTTGKYLFTDLPCNYLKEGAQEGSKNPADYVGNTYFEYYVEFGIPDGYTATARYADPVDEKASDIDSNIDAEGITEPITLKLTVGEDDGVLIGEDNLTIDAGYVRLVNLGDYVWIDSNKDGIQDASEIGLNGVTVNLYKLDSETDTIEGKKPYRTQLTAKHSTTEKDGYYYFGDLPKGYYVVEFDISNVEKPVGYTTQYEFTTPDAGSNGADSDAKYIKDENNSIMYTDVIHLTEDDMTWDAGVTVYSALGGFVFDDQDYNDTQSIETILDETTTSPGIPLIGNDEIGKTVVTLYKVNEDGTMDPTPVASQEVGPDGRYLFDKLDAGRYKVHFDYPDNYVGVTPGVGDYLHDSETTLFDDETLNSGFTDVIELPPDTADLTHDAGAYLLSAIGDYVWEDINKDGIQDEDEKPVEGIVVTLQQKVGEDGEWESVETAITDENGLYKFIGLKSSDHYDIEYRVAFGISRTVVLTKDNQGDDRAVDSNALPEYDQELGYFSDVVKPGYGLEDLTIDAGLYYQNELCEIGDYVWHDKNKDGIQDADEEGVKGISVILEYCESGEIWDDAQWVQVGETKTDANGKYIFTELPPGYYRVAFGVGEDPWVVTKFNSGNEVNDSNAIRPVDKYYYTSVFYMNSGESDMTWDAGIYKVEEKDKIINTIIEYIYVNGVKTGDPAPLIMLFAMLLASAGVIVVLTRRRRKKVK